MPERSVKIQGCDHGIDFDPKAAEGMKAFDIRRRWPRLLGECPKRCGARGILYASEEHYNMGDW